MLMRRLLFVLPVLVFLGVGIALAVGLTRDPSVLSSVLIDQSVPQFTLPPVAGVDLPGFASDDLRGEVVLVNVFASWCVPCRIEHPLLMRLASQGVKIFAINYKDAPADARAFLDQLGNPFARFGADPDGRVAIDWGVYGIPETFVTDREGRIRYKKVGPFTPRDIDQELAPLLAELGGPVLAEAGR